jgi:hypothetical protein
VWYLDKGVTLPKNNLARKNWQGDLKCSFCNADENIQHLFFDSPIARFIWRIIQVSFNITPPTSFHHIFTHWLGATKIGVKKIIWSGICAIYWAILLCRNNVIFAHKFIPSYIEPDFGLFD